MSEYICKEVLTDNGGYLEAVEELIRCKDCRYYGERMINGYWGCNRIEGCVKTIPEGFCGWGVRKDNGQNG